MNIQPSIMVWTVICFLILTVILKKLLFTPVLEIMDSRREKIKAAAKKKEDIEKLVLEHKNQVEKEKALAKEKSRKDLCPFCFLYLLDTIDIDACEGECRDSFAIFFSLRRKFMVLPPSSWRQATVHRTVAFRWFKSVCPRFLQNKKHCVSSAFYFGGTGQI